MPAREVARELVIAAATDHKFDFVVRLQDFEIFDMESVALTRVRTLHINDLHNTSRNPLQWPFAAGFDQYLVAGLKHSLHERNQFSFLQHGFAAGDLNQSRSWAQALNFIEDLVGRHFLATVK